MKAIIDCNSFYCSCERLFRPDLWDRPVVVLSNNDGCIISRTDEAKKAGLAMGVPLYQHKKMIEEKGIAVFSSNYHLYGDLSRRLIFLLLALVVYRVGAHIPVPGIDPQQLQQLFNGQQGGILNLFNMFSGGALSRFTVFALGIMPYISASIIIQLMSSVSPHLEQLKKEGEQGRKRINQYTRYGTVLLAVLQSYGIAVGLEGREVGPRHTLDETQTDDLAVGKRFHVPREVRPARLRQRTIPTASRCRARCGCGR